MSQSPKTNPAKPRCGLCGKTKNLVKNGTNEYNFEKLENPPHFEPTRCDRCGVVIKLGTDGHSVGPRGTLCERCTDLDGPGSPPAPRPKRPAASRKPKLELPANPNSAAIEIILSAKVQARWPIKPCVGASEPSAHWLGQWRVDFAQKADRTWVALVTNVATLYTFVLPLKDLGKHDNFEKLFRLRLVFALTDAPSLALWKDAPLVFAHGNPRVTVGSMNEMRKHLAWRTETEVGPMKDDEDWINKTPFLSLPGFFPGKSFTNRLAETNETQRMNSH